MADWYVSSVAYAALPQFAASGVYTVGQIVRPLTAPALGKAHAFRCTTAGTASTEPAWPTANNSTVTTGGATFTNVTGQSAYGWGAAAGDLYSISATALWNRPLVGDRVFLSSDHSESSAPTSWSFAAAGYGVLEIISVNRAGSVPPVVADIQNGAAITYSSAAGTQNMVLDAFCNMYWQGITFTISGSASNASIRFAASGFKKHYFKNCNLVLGTGTAGSVGYTGGQVVFDNTAVQFNNAAQYVGTSSQAQFDLTWINTSSPISGATIPTTLFSCVALSPQSVVCRGVDFSAVTGTLVGILTTNNASPCKILLDSCKIAPSVTRLLAPTSTSGTEDVVELVNCWDGINVLNERHTAAGDITTDRSTYLTSGAQDDIGNYALKLVSSSRNDFATFPLDCFAFDVENTVTGASKTATVEIVSSSTLNNSDIRLLLEYMGGSYATWNPADLTNTTLSNGNLTVTALSAIAIGARATGGLSSGKYYWEVTMPTWSSPVSIGFGLGSASFGSLAGFAVVQKVDGHIHVNGTDLGSATALGGRANGDIIGIAVDLTNNLCWFRVSPSGSWNATSGTANNPATGTGGVSISSIATGLLFPAFIGNAAGDAATANFGASAFSGAVPSGFTPGWGTVSTATPVASFADSLPSVLTAASALPSSSNTWTGPASTTWNSNDLLAMTLSNGNLTATSTTNPAGVRAITGFASGKYYWEVTLTAWASGAQTGFGLSGASFNVNSTGNANVGKTTGAITVNNVASGSTLGARANGDIIGIALDIGNGLVWFRVAPSGNWNGSGTANPATGAGGVSISSINTGPLFPMHMANASGEIVTANFGASAFSGAVPSGFAAGWSGTPASKQLLQVTFTPQRAGRVRGLIRLGKPSTTVWADPRIKIT